MNSIYKTVWSKSSQTMIAVSELTKSSGKSNKVSGQIINPKASLSKLVIALIVGLSSGNVLAASNSTELGYTTPNPLDNANLKNDVIQIGDGANANGKEIVAGNGAAAVAPGGSIAIGKDSIAGAAGTVVIGRNAQAGVDATGKSADGTQAVAIGESSTVSANWGIAIGFGSKSGENIDAQKTVAIGSDAQAKKLEAIAMGYESVAEGKKSVAIGSNTFADKTAVAVGVDTNATNNSIAMGNGGKATGDSSIALGRGAKSAGENAIAIGGFGEDDVFFDNSLPNGGDWAVKGYTEAQAKRSVAMGYRAMTTIENSVSLGALSKDKAAASINTATVGSLTYEGFAGKEANNGVISVGDASKERQIVNVGAGAINKTSTDAINGSQLYATNNALSNTAQTVTDLLGGNAVLTPDTDKVGSITFTNIGGTGKDNINDAIKKLGDQINNATAGTDTTSVEEVTASDGITVTPKDASATKDKSFKVAVNTDGDTIKIEGGKVTANTSPVTVDDTVGTVTAPASPNALATAGDVANAINGAFHTVKNTDTKTQVTKAEGSTKIKAGSNLTIEAGKNLASAMVDESGVLQISTEANVEFDDVKVGDVVINKDTGINAGNKKITGVAAGTEDTDAVNKKQLDDKIKLSKEEVTAGKGVTVKTTPATADKGASFEVAVKTDDKTITTDKDGNITAVTTDLANDPNKAGAIAAPQGDDAKKLVNAGDIATAINNSGFMITASGNLDGSATEEMVNPGDKVELVAGDNLTIKQEAGKFTLSAVLPATVETPFGYVDAAGNPVTKKGDKFVDAAGNDVPVADVVVKAKGNEPQQVTNIKSTLPGSVDKDALTPAQEKAQTAPTFAGDELHNAATVSDVLSSGWNLQNNGKAKDLVKPYDTVNFVDGEGTTVVVDTKAGQTTSDIKVNVATDNVTTQLVKKDGKKVIAAKTAPLEVDNAKGMVKAPAQPKALATAGDVADAINGAFHTVSNENTDVIVAEKAETVKVKAGSTLKVNAGKNLSSSLDASGNLAISTKSNVEFDDVKVGDVVINKDAGINAGNKQIKGVKAGVEDTDAVNVSQLKGLKAANLNISNKLDDLDTNMRAGIAGAYAAANLGQPHDPGASTVGIAVGNYRGESALSLGLSTISDNGKWILKGSVTHDTSRHTGAGASINYQW